MKTAAPAHTWSLCQELGTLELAAQGCAIAVAQIYEIHDDERAAKALAFQTEALLTLLHLRLRDLGRVLRGELDPAVLAAPHNVVPPDGSRTNPGEDVVFVPKADVRTKRAGRRSRR